VRPSCSEGPATSPDQSPDRATTKPEGGGFEGDSGSCERLKTQGGQYAVQVQGFTRSSGPECREVQRIMSAYLKNIAPKDGQVEEWRCTYSQRVGIGGQAAVGVDEDQDIAHRGRGPGVRLPRAAP